MERCHECGRRLQAAEDSNALLLEQQRLSAEICRSKDELNALAKALQDRGKSPTSGQSEEEAANIQGLFNKNNIESLQELLDQAEESEQALLFMDNKGNTWQITQRPDIDLPDEDIPDAVLESDVAHNPDPDPGPDLERNYRPDNDFHQGYDNDNDGGNEHRPDFGQEEPVEQHHSELTPPSDTN